MLRQLRQRMQQSGPGVAAIDHQDPENLYRVQLVCLGIKERGALFHRRADERIFVFGTRHLRTVVPEQNLIQPCLVVERAQRSFETFHHIIPPSMVETFGIDPADLQSAAEVAGFRQEAVLVPEAAQVHLRHERPSFLPVLRDGVNLEHFAS